MANTVIQIKRSSVTTAPTAGSLSAAEPAYSYLSDKLFLGSSDGTQVVEIGGRYYVNVAISAYNTGNNAQTIAIAAFTAANSGSSAAAAFDKANAANIIASQAFDKANAANVLAFNTGIGANAYADAVGAGANSYMIAVQNGSNTAVGTGANAYAASVGVGANAFASATIAGANTAVGAGANAFASATIAGANSAVGAGANAFASATIAGANTAVGAGANAYSDSTFVKLTAANQTITGNLAISGSLSIAGNTFKIDANTLYVQDPLIYLAGNNYTSDIVDIGFVGNYVSGNGQNLHTGLFRDATVKEYYLFQGYNKEPNFNDIDPVANGFFLSVLNADIRTSNLNLGGTNAIVWITSAFDAANAANVVLTANVNYVNTAMQSAFLVANSASVNASAAFAAANNGSTIGSSAFLVANSASTNASAAFAKANTVETIATSSFLVANSGSTNASASFIVANSASVNATAAFDKANGASSNVSAAWDKANSGYTIASLAYDKANTANVNAANASFINTGILAVGYGGTGVTSFTNNGILFGNTTGGIRVTAAGTEGNVLQVNLNGIPVFGMLDGGSF